MRIDGQGRVYSGGEEVAQLRIARFDQPEALATEDGQMFAATGDSGEPQYVAEPAVVSGALEGSNVDLSGTMVEMIDMVRMYQLNQQVLSTQDESLQQALNQIPGQA